MAELAARRRQRIEEPAPRRRIQEAGTAWAREHFTGLHHWARMVHCLYEAAPPSVAVPKAEVVRIDIPGPPADMVPYLQRLGAGASGR